MPGLNYKIVVTLYLFFSFKYLKSPTQLHGACILSETCVSTATETLFTISLKLFIYFLFMPLWKERLNPSRCLSPADVYGDSVHAFLIKKNLYFLSTVLAAYSFYRHFYNFFVCDHLHYLRHTYKVFVGKAKLVYCNKY